MVGLGCIQRTNLDESFSMGDSVSMFWQVSLWMAATLIDFYINVFAISYVQMYTSLIIPFLWRKNDLCYWLPGMGCSQGVNLDQCILLDLFVDMLWQVCI
ncbi:hypothetical protein BHE74_00017784 [Ensete ventricosum]|nr:hypothetical protein GW17_00040020 [Ensete ventricosum]RWW74284.1 hypothetical protein BHE74_00017784 [Ensete ventricosum]RZR84632.1 hypothetical protein BHM03_00011487 [Ensete ventricosum]